MVPTAQPKRERTSPIQLSTSKQKDDAPPRRKISNQLLSYWQERSSEAVSIVPSASPLTVTSMALPSSPPKARYRHTIHTASYTSQTVQATQARPKPVLVNVVLPSFPYSTAGTPATTASTAPSDNLSSGSIQDNSFMMDPPATRRFTESAANPLTMENSDSFPTAAASAATNTTNAAMRGSAYRPTGADADNIITDRPAFRSSRANPSKPKEEDTISSADLPSSPYDSKAEIYNKLYPTLATVGHEDDGENANEANYDKIKYASNIAERSANLTTAGISNDKLSNEHGESSLHDFTLVPSVRMQQQHNEVKEEKQHQQLPDCAR